MQKLLKYSSFIYPLVVFLGYFYIDTYYDLFGISIYPYLDISEILLSFLTGVNYFIIIGLWFLFVSVFPSIIITESKPIRIFEKKIVSSKKLKNIWFIVTMSASLIGISFLFYSLVKEFLENLDKIELYKLVGLFFLSVFVFVLGIRYLYKKINLNEEDVPEKKYLIYLFIFFISSFYTYFLAYSSYKLILIKDDLDYVKFEYHNNQIESSDSIVYVGSTNNYIFMHNLSSRLNYIYEKNNISNLIYASGSKFLTSAHNRYLESGHLNDSTNLSNKIESSVPILSDTTNNQVH